MSEGQAIALKQLERLARVENSSFRIDNVEAIEKPNDPLLIDVSIDCSSYQREPGGLDLHDRESVRISVHSDFPFRVPRVDTLHSRFLGFPHVQWGRHLCLYISPETQWLPSRGMIGFVEQLDEWFRKSAINELDAPEEPMHPPIAYPVATTTVWVNADTPSVNSWPWFGAAVLNTRKPGLLEIIRWEEMHTSPQLIMYAPVILLNFQLPFEYPNTVCQLLDHLKKGGVDYSRVIVHLMLAAVRLPVNHALYVIIGTPSRGITGDYSRRLQHLQAWEIEPVNVDTLRDLATTCDIMKQFGDITTSTEFQTLFTSVINDLTTWQFSSRVRWCSVMENRPEIVIRRDEGTAMDWFSGKTVALWGCGALGGVVAECLARSNAKALRLYDNGIVNPGILVRQNFIEDDINDYKTHALRRRLLAINPGIEVSVHVVDLISTTFSDMQWQHDVDVVIDATASLRVRSKLEFLLKSEQLNIPVAAMMISAAAQHGAMVLTRPGYSGGPFDVYQRLGLATMNRYWLKDWTDAFWTPKGHEQLRQPEPGCSDPTFVGSYSDVAGLAVRMLNQVAIELASVNDQASGYLIAQNVGHKLDQNFTFEPDILVTDGGMQFRVATAVWRDVKGWIRSGARERSPEHETGGLLFGQIDEPLGICWISNVSGPPRDSKFSPEGFVCGIDGISAVCDEYRERSRGTIQYVGTWHSHPVSPASPSNTDFAGVASIFASAPNQGAFQLMMIVGNSSKTNPEIGIYAFEKFQYHSDIDCKAIEMACQGAKTMAPAIKPIKKPIGLALSGGGSRAVAFHLGTLRALDDLGLLDEIETISGVSGGSLMTGLIGYSDDDFTKIDDQTVAFLKRGLVPTDVQETPAPKTFYPTHICISIGSLADNIS